MSEKKEIFVDTIGQLHFIKGLVRFDLVSFQPGENSGAEPIPQEVVRVIMPPEGFLATFNTMQRLIDQLVEAGVLKKVNNENKKK